MELVLVDKSSIPKRSLPVAYIGDTILRVDPQLLGRQVEDVTEKLCPALSCVAVEVFQKQKIRRLW